MGLISQLRISLLLEVLGAGVSPICLIYYDVSQAKGVLVI